MTVLVFEDNLMWSSRIIKSLQALGHTPVLISSIIAQIPEASAAIVNLGSPKLNPTELIPILTGAGVFVIAHAGHKEMELRKLGKELGCDRLASNSELTFKLEALLRDVQGGVAGDE